MKIKEICKPNSCNIMECKECAEYTKSETCCLLKGLINRFCKKINSKQNSRKSIRDTQKDKLQDLCDEALVLAQYEKNHRAPNSVEKSIIVAEIGKLKACNFKLDSDFYTSIAMAHNDMARRASGHKDVIKIASIVWFRDRFSSISPFNIDLTIDPQNAFNTWHDKTCCDYCEYMNTFITRVGLSFEMTYGKAQKVLNMIFKYLYCTKSYNAEVEKISEYLHMTLDGYTLHWYKESIVAPSTLKKGDVSEWSKMEQYKYIDIQGRIRGYLMKNGQYINSINVEIVDENINEESFKSKTVETRIDLCPIGKYLPPFYAEFIIWEGEIVRSKTEGLLKGLNGIYKSWKCDRWAISNGIKDELKKKVDIIKKYL